MTLATPMLLLSLVVVGPAREPFAIRVVDEATGRGVPLVTLTTTDATRHVTDNAGLVAFDEPGLMGTPVYFAVTSHGYEHRADGFGFRGTVLRPIPGGEATIKVRRLNVAERLYRVTGGGLYRDSILLARPAPLKNPAINGLVLGQDSVFNGILGGTLYWFWGDTTRPSYPLGNFHMPGATSLLPTQGGLDPDVGVDLTYFLDDQGFARPTAKLPGDGPTWISGVVVLKEADGRERMLGSYVKIRNMLEAYEHGAVEFDPAKAEWIRRATWPEKAPIYPSGQATVVRDSEGDWVIFANGLPDTRVRADAASYFDLSRYEAWTPLKPGSRADRPEVERDRDGRVVLGFKRDVPPLSREVQARLIRSGGLKPDEATVTLRDVQAGKPIRPHTSSLAWNEYRKAWSLIVLEIGGTSQLGEVWYAEAPSPTGPWVDARKVVTHDRYSFYNPRQHPYFAKDGGRLIYFEATYTHTFSGNPDQTPRYDYNQVMYRLDLDDPRLNLPRRPPGLGEGDAFLAPTRPGPGLVAVLDDGEGGLRLGTGAAGESARFFVVPTGAKDAPPAAVPLVEYADGPRRVYSTDPGLDRPGLRKTGRDLGRAWPDPTRTRTRGRPSPSRPPTDPAPG